MKFGGTSVADAERIKRAARRIVERAKERAAASSRCCPRAASTPTSWSRWRTRSRPSRTRARWTCCSRRASGSPARSARWRSTTSAARRSRCPARRPASSPTPSHTKARILDVRADRIRAGARRGQHRAGRRLPGRLDARATSPRSAAAAPTPPRSRSRRRSAPRSARSTPTWPASSRADPRIVPDARKLPVRLVRGDARDGGLGRAACCSCARSSTRATTASASTCRSSFGDGSGTLVPDEDETMERPLVTAVTHSTDEARVTLTGVPDRPGHRRPHLRRARRRRRQRRHDHPERARVATATAPRSRSRSRATTWRPRARRSSALGASSASAAIADRRADGQGLARRRGNAQPSRASRRRSSQTLGEAGVNIEMISTSPIKISCVIARGARAGRGARAARRRSSSARTRSCPRTSPGEPPAAKVT